MALSSLWLATSVYAQQPQEEEEIPFQEPERSFTAGVLVDLRFAYTDRIQSFLDGGLGKVRYGGDEDGDRRALARLAQLSFLADAQFTPKLGAHLHLNVDAEPDRGSLGDRLDLIEAFLRYHFAVAAEKELRGRVGLFFPPLSLENVGPAWTPVYTITPSVINSWVGEEVRAGGAEVTFAHVGLENEISVSGSVLGWNDPSGSLLAFRGWAARDRQTGFHDRIPLAPLPAIRPGGVFQTQAGWTAPITEIDHRAGYYAAGSWERYQRLTVNGIYYDNRANPMAFDSGQYGWHTKFYDAGLDYSFGIGAQGPELLFQFLSGNTWMGNVAPGLPKVRVDFRSAYVLFTVPLGAAAVLVPLTIGSRPSISTSSGSSTTMTRRAQPSRSLISCALRKSRGSRSSFWGFAAIARPVRRSACLPGRDELLFQASYRLRF